MNNPLQTNLLQPPVAWDWYEKILFRFFFVFFILFILSAKNGAFKGDFASLSAPISNQLNKLVPSVSKQVLKIPYEFEQNGYGGGDNTYSYVVLFILFAISIIGCLLWSVIDLRRKNYNALYYWLTVAIRYYIAFTLLHYGLAKIFKVQFYSSEAWRLLQPYGESSPMGLAWTFLGFSDGYNILMGLAELAALLLLFRRTLTAGLVITLFTTINIMAVNYFFDAPVKILSTALVVMTLFLLAHDGKRLWTFLFTGRAVSLPVIYEPKSRHKWVTYLKTGTKIAIICFTVYSFFKTAIEQQKLFQEYTSASSIAGVYEVENFHLNNQDLSPNRNDSVRWQRLYISSGGRASIMYMNDSLKKYTATTLPLSKVIHLTSSANPHERDTLHFESNDKGLYQLTGKINQDSVAIRLKKVDVSKFPLMKRGFHWINERPNNH